MVKWCCTIWRPAKIAGIWNAMSGRRIGDPSLLDEEAAGYAAAPVLGPYEKTGSGRGASEIRHGGIARRGSGIAARRSALHQFGCLAAGDRRRQLLAAFVIPRQEQPQALFRRDWRETARAKLHAWLKTRGLNARALTREERIELIAALDADGLFEARRAVEHVAEMIGVSRAAAYGYLTQARAVPKRSRA